MKFSSLRLILGLLIAVPNVYAADDTGSEKTVVTSKNSGLFYDNKQGPVKFNYSALIKAAIEGNERAIMLDRVFPDLKYSRLALLKCFPFGQIVLHGITPEDLCLTEGEDYYPDTLLKKLDNPLNDKEYGISVIPDGQLIITYEFASALVGTDKQSDYRETKLHNILVRAGLMDHLKSHPEETFDIPTKILKGSDLDIDIKDDNLIKLQNFFGLKLQDTEIGKLLKEINPELQFTSKRQMKNLFQELAIKASKENVENKKLLLIYEEKITELNSRFETAKVEEDKLKKQQDEDAKKIAQHLEENQSLSKRVEELTISEKTLTEKTEQQLQAYEALNANASKLTSGISRLMEEFSNK